MCSMIQFPLVCHNCDLGISVLHSTFLLFVSVDLYLFAVNGHRKQQLSYTENQQNTVSFSNFIDARLTYNKVWCVLTGVLHTPEPQR